LLVGNTNFKIYTVSIYILLNALKGLDCNTKSIHLLQNIVIGLAPGIVFVPPKLFFFVLILPPQPIEIVVNSRRRKY